MPSMVKTIAALCRRVLPISFRHVGRCFGMYLITEGKSRAARVGTCPKASGCPAKRLTPPPGFASRKRCLAVSPGGTASRNGPIREPWTGGGGTKVIRLAKGVPGLQRITYWCGGSPVAALNCRAKW
jgi:hypothetical protein